MQTLIPPEDSGGHYPDKKIKCENNWEYKCLRHFSSPTSKQTCILCEPSRALKALSSNSASEERRKSDVTPVCFQTSNLQDTNTCASTICTIITFMTVQIAHYYHTIEMWSGLTEALNTGVILLLNSERRGGSDKVGNGCLYWLLQSTATLQIKCRGQSSSILLP